MPIASASKHTLLSSATIFNQSAGRPTLPLSAPWHTLTGKPHWQLTRTERQLRTLADGAKALLTSAGLPDRFLRSRFSHYGVRLLPNMVQG
jgi:hypothetical protein